MGKSHTANQHKQGIPEAEGRNDTSPLKGIDTQNRVVRVKMWVRRNDTSPLKGIDTPSPDHTPQDEVTVEMVPA